MFAYGHGSYFISKQKQIEMNLFSAENGYRKQKSYKRTPKLHGEQKNETFHLKVFNCCKKNALPTDNKD